MKESFIIAVFFLLTLSVDGQYLPENTKNKNIYDFIDELASNGILIINQAIKPYSKQNIAKWLNDATKKKHLLNRRQQKEVDFYNSVYSNFYGPPNYTSLKLFKNPLNLFYNDSLFRIIFQPIIGGTLYCNNSGVYQNRLWGATVNGSVSKNFSFYTSLTDHWETQILSNPTYLTQLSGGKYKPSINRKGGDYSTIKGGLTWSWNWGHLGLIYDNVSWGSGYNGSIILTERAPPFPQLSLKLTPVKWFEFNYLHGWLASDIIDSTRTFKSNNGYKKVFYEKYIAANMFTFFPWSFLQFSMGNSIIYSNPKVYIGYLIPTLFFRSVDENYSYLDNNSQMFMDLSIRASKNIRIYGSVFSDELRLSRIFDPSQSNLYSVKVGSKFLGLLNNLYLTAEYTRTNPITYKHQLSVLTYSSNKYSLGHYLRDNSEEFFAAIEWKPLSRLKMYLEYLDARHYNEYEYKIGAEAVRFPVLKDNIWKNRSITGGFTYELFHEIVIKGSILISDIKGFSSDGQSDKYWLNMFTPQFLQGKKVTLEGGFNIGF